MEMVFQVNGGIAESGMQDPSAPTFGVVEAEGGAKAHVHHIWEWRRLPRFSIPGQSLSKI